MQNENSDIYTQEELKVIFKDAVSDEILQKIQEENFILSKTVTERRATAFIFDLHKFSYLEQRMGSEKCRKILSDIFETIKGEVLSRGGYVCNYIGDAAIILFGVPISSPEREQALAAAELSMLLIEKTGDCDVKAGIGFNTGPLSFGNYGPDTKPLFSPIGDTINNASVLEELSRRNGFRATTTEYVNELIGDEFRFAHVYLIEPEGRRKQISDSYALIGRYNEMEEEEHAFWDRYDQAMQLVENNRIVKALSIFLDLKKLKPDDSLIENMFDYICHFYVQKSEEIFSSFDNLPLLFKEVKKAVTLLFGDSDIAFLEQEIDGLWKFKRMKPLKISEIVLSPGGESIIWMKGLLNAEGLTNAPPPLNGAGFAFISPIRKDNELTAALLVNCRENINLSVLFALSSAFTEHWTTLRLKDREIHYQQKVDDAVKLEEVNRELEYKSGALQKLLDENKTLNQELQKRVDSHAARLERAALLKRYLPPAVVENIINGDRDLSPITERKKLTVLFSDIRGFTTATDGLEPEELSRLLNEYLSSMSRIAFKAGATIDKFRGDGMMVFFGAPRSGEPKEGALKCIHMAREMCMEVGNLGKKWFNEGYDWNLGVRIGINTGYATVGEFGSDERMDYTAIGTEVNLAARLEEACSLNSILISHSTWALVKEEFSCREREILNLKGIHRPVRTYEIIVDSI